jgi:hypothetical protein
MGGQGAGIIGWKGGSLGLRSPGEVEEVASVLAEALNRQNSTGRLHSEVGSQECIDASQVFLGSLGRSLGFLRLLHQARGAWPDRALSPAK